MRPLTVNTQTSRRLRAIEKPLEDDCGDICKDVGRLWLKADATDGWPDRYLGGGVWIEFKATAFERAATLYPLLRTEQHAVCRTLQQNGDTVCVAILLVDTETNTRLVWWQNYSQFAKLKGRRLHRHEIMEGAWGYSSFLLRFDNFVRSLGCTDA